MGAEIASVHGSSTMQNKEHYQNTIVTFDIIVAHLGYCVCLSSRTNWCHTWCFSPAQYVEVHALVLPPRPASHSDSLDNVIRADSADRIGPFPCHGQDIAGPTERDPHGDILLLAHH